MNIWLGSIAIFIGLFGSSGFAKTRIAFIEKRDPQGRLIQYEPGGRFVHTALQFEELHGQWVDAYPGSGVSLISWDQLQTRGTVANIVEIPQDLGLSSLAPYLHRPFDFWYSWSDEAIYCSELIGKLLKISPNPMRFHKKTWPKSYWKLEGTPGLSPDDLYRWALEQGH